MNRKAYLSILAVVFLAISFLTGCSSSSSAPPVIGITGATPAATVTVTTAYGPLTAAVTSNGSPVGAGVAVIFTVQPGANGAGGTFAGGASTETDMTDSTGTATSSIFTANYAPGPFGVVASTLPAAGSTINLTNGGGVYSFYLSGYEAGFVTPNFYALTGSVLLDASGDIISGEQDYNDGIGIQSPEPLPDTIAPLTAGLSLVNGQGTLTLVTSNPELGNAGTETLAVQFVNNNHALIEEFDGFATSSGSLDLQTSPNTPVSASAGFAFTLTGVDTFDDSIVFGGVGATDTTGTTLTGFFDVNDAGTVTTGVPINAGVVISAPDFYGRGSITGTGIANTLNYYVVGPEALRLIDVDLTDSAIGSAFGQGTATFTNASIGPSVLAFQSSASGDLYAAAGSIATVSTVTPATFAGIADDDEEGFASSGVAIAGTYSVSNIPTGGTTAVNGYSSLTMGAGTGVGSVVNLGLYFTDPALNLSDPNNTSGGGGALITDLDAVLVGTGVLIPQTDTTPTDVTGNYAFGAQDYFCTICEFDAVGQGSVAAGVLTNWTGILGDPDDFFGGGDSGYIGTTFMGTPLADTTPPESTTGRYTMFESSTPANPLVVTVPTTVFADLSVVVYQASATQLFWLDEDTFSIWLGPIEQQGTLSGLAAVKRAAAKTKIKKW